MRRASQFAHGLTSYGPKIALARLPKVSSMKFFLRLFRLPEKQESELSKPTRYSARVAIQREHAAADGHHEEASFGWLGQKAIDSSIFDPPGRPATSSADSGTATCRMIATDQEVHGGNDNDSGYDPYNTGRIESARNGR
jgi:hypothetical protein